MQVAEDLLFRRAATLCSEMDKVYAQAIESNLAPAHKRQVVEAAAESAQQAGSLLNEVIRRYLRSL